MTAKRMKELLNSTIDYISVGEGLGNVIRALLSIGFTSEELIEEFNFSATDVCEAEE